MVHGETVPACHQHRAHPQTQYHWKDIKGPLAFTANNSHAQGLEDLLPGGRPEASGPMKKVSIWAGARSTAHVPIVQLPTVPQDATAFLPEP